MSITQLDVHALRNITTLRVYPHARWNVIFGENGSGKTSLLEAISLVSTGRSFRTNEVNALVRDGEDALMLFARTAQDETIQLKKNKAGMSAWIDQKICARRSELAQRLPCQIFYQDIFSIIDAGPSVRRSLLDWGLFHVKHQEIGLWREYARVLKQRNSLLRQQAAHQHVKPWDCLLEELSEALHERRQAFCSEWFLRFDETLAQLTTQSCSVRYEKGWDRKNTGKRLLTILDEQWESDKIQQYTHSGAHQADLILTTPSLKVKQSLSRGQQKMILLALKLSQAELIASQCVYLLDDVFSELDSSHIQRLLSHMETLKGQFFFTCIQPDLFSAHLPSSRASFLSMQHGQLMSA